MNTRISTLAALTCLLSAGFLLHAPATAQYLPNSSDLYAQGANTYPGNCVTGSKFYFAYLQRVQNVPATNRNYMLQRIQECETKQKQQQEKQAGNDVFYSGTFTLPSLSQDPLTRRCNSYAVLALTQQGLYKTGSCGPATNRWSSNYDRHFNWCADPAVSTADLRSEIAERQKVLDACVFK